VFSHFVSTDTFAFGLRTVFYSYPDHSLPSMSSPSRGICPYVLEKKEPSFLFETSPSVFSPPGPTHCVSVPPFFPSLGEITLLLNVKRPVIPDRRDRPPLSKKNRSIFSPFHQIFFFRSLPLSFFPTSPFPFS